MCAVTALAATFLSQHYGGPQLLYALLIGLSLHFLSLQESTRAGIDFCGKTCCASASPCWESASPSTR